MSYTMLTAVAVLVVLSLDLWGLRTRTVTSASFWLSYAIVVFFQLLTNAVLTGREVVRYEDEAILGVGNAAQSPAFIGEGRIFFAPIEDLFFGFAFVLLTVSIWRWLGRRGIQPTPLSGPPRWRADQSGSDPGP